MLTLASPQTIVRAYFDEARNLINSAATIKTSEVHGKIAAAIILCFSATEAFFNSFYYILAKEKNHSEVLHLIVAMRAHKKRLGLRNKIIDWTKQLFSGKQIDEKILDKFLEIQRRRNELVHISGGDLSINYGNIEIKGLHDLKFFHEIDIQYGLETLAICRELIGAVGQLAGNDKDQFLQLWTG